MKEKKYRPRIADLMLDFKLHSKGAVIIEGPKWVGKTTTAKRFAKSVVELGDDRDQNQNIFMASIDLNRIIKGETPRLFDEWQEVPALWDALRYEVDKRNEVSQFILTGSSIKTSKKFGTDARKHTGTGRFSYLLMRSMSLYESGDSNGVISLGELFRSPAEIFAENTLELEDIVFLACRGGWPFATFLEGEYALAQARDYYASIIKEDISRVDGKKRDQRILRRLLRAYARVQAQGYSMDALSKDIGDVDSRTVADYLDALRRIYVIDDVEAWNPNLRSKTAVRTSDTRYFVDPSIAVAALGVGVQDMLNDLKTFGFIFETMCVRDLRVYASAIDGEVYHYRDKSGLECDAVVHLRNGKYGLIEIKLGGTELIEDGAEKLKTLQKNIDVATMGTPSFCAVITGVGKYAYRRPDGVFVVPIGCLKP